MTFEELYREVLKQTLKPDGKPLPEHEAGHLDCLLYPEKYPPVLRTESCEKCEYDQALSLIHISPPSTQSPS